MTINGNMTIEDGVDSAEINGENILVNGNPNSLDFFIKANPTKIEYLYHFLKHKKDLTLHLEFIIDNKNRSGFYKLKIIELNGKYKIRVIWNTESR